MILGRMPYKASFVFVVFSIFFCGCKQPKSIHIVFRLQRYEKMLRVATLGNQTFLLCAVAIGVAPCFFAMPLCRKCATVVAQKKEGRHYVPDPAMCFSSSDIARWLGLWLFDFCQRDFDEVPFVYERMGEGEAFSVYAQVVIPQQVNVDGAVVVYAVLCFFCASQFALYFLCFLKTFERGELGLHQAGRVDEGVFAVESPWGGFDER